MDTVIRAFQYLTTCSNIYLLVAGSGSKLSDWRELAGEMGNPRILFHTPWLDSETSSVLDAASLFILPTQNNQSLVSVPSKLIAYMLAGRPILCSAGEKSDIANIIDEAACGWVIPTDSPEVISQRILSLSQQPPDELHKFGERGKSYALKNMTKTVNLPKLVNLIQSTQ